MVRRIVRLFPYCVGLLLLASLAFASLARVERVVESGGEVRVQKYQFVRPQVSGLVVEVRVEPGDVVVKNQVLIQLKDYDLQRELISVRQQSEAVRSRLDRLLAERRLRALESHPLEIERQRMEIERSFLDSAVGASKVEEAAIELEAARERHRQARQLVDFGVISQQERQKARQVELAAEQRLAQSRLQERLTRSHRPSLENELSLLRSEQHHALAELEAQIRELEAQAKQWRAQFAQLEKLRDLHTLRAGMDGVVIGSPTNDLLGQYVQTGRDLFGIIDVASVSFVTQVPEQAIVQVRSGQPAYVEISGLPKDRFRVFPGEVARVSQEPVSDTKANMALYPVYIHLEAPWIELHEGRFYLRSGMRGTAKIAYRHSVPLFRAIYEFLIGKPQLPDRTRLYGEPMRVVKSDLRNPRPGHDR